MDYTLSCGCGMDCPRNVNVEVKTDGTLCMIVHNLSEALGIRVTGDDLIVLAREALIAYHIANKYQQH